MHAMEERCSSTTARLSCWYGKQRLSKPACFPMCVQSVHGTAIPVQSCGLPFLEPLRPKPIVDQGDSPGVAARSAGQDWFSGTSTAPITGLNRCTSRVSSIGRGSASRSSHMHAIRNAGNEQGNNPDSQSTCMCMTVVVSQKVRLVRALFQWPPCSVQSLEVIGWRTTLGTSQVFQFRSRPVLLQVRG